MFGLDDWGYAVIDGAEIAPDLVGLVRRAAELSLGTELPVTISPVSK